MDKDLTIKNNARSRRGFIQDLTKWIGGTALLAAAANILTSNKIKADTKSINGGTPFVGEIMKFGGNFAPRGWTLCDGQLLSVSSNDALFSLLGTIYGGDGRTTFGLPDLRGRVPVHPGSGPGLATIRVGEKNGAHEVTLITNQIPSHSHALNVNAGGGNSANPAGNFISANSEGIKHHSGSSSSTADAASISNFVGGGQSHTNIQPYLAIHYCIALFGVYPSRY